MPPVYQALPKYLRCPQPAWPAQPVEGGVQRQTHLSAYSQLFKCPPVSIIGYGGSILRLLSPSLLNYSKVLVAHGVKRGQTYPSTTRERNRMPLPAEGWSCLQNGNLSTSRSEYCQHHLGIQGPRAFIMHMCPHMCLHAC